MLALKNAAHWFHRWFTTVDSSWRDIFFYWIYPQYHYGLDAPSVWNCETVPPVKQVSWKSSSRFVFAQGNTRIWNCLCRHTGLCSSSRGKILRVMKRIVTACSRRRLKNIFLYKTTFFLNTVDFHIGFYSMCKNGRHASLHIMFEVVVNSSILLFH